jgi:hypothetical protein
VRVISRKDSNVLIRSRILRDYTPGAVRKNRDDIVRSAQRCAELGRNVRAPDSLSGVTNMNGPKVAKFLVG